ncbi:MAG: DUF4249 domain-containing protein [Saprospiraceae bacterium]|nr:DUF4249 domain-containing protein [Saprospiraceae bacterium]
MKKISLFMLLFCSLTACEEVILLDLDTATQRVVIEANLDAGKGICTVSLSKTSGFYDSNNFEKITGAAILLTTSGEANIPVIQDADGHYSATGIDIAPGESARLRIELPNGQVIESETVPVPYPAPLDALMTEKVETGGPSGNGTSEAHYMLTAKWQDIPGQSNYYRLKIFQNDAFQSGTYILSDDRFGDGLPIVRPVIRQTFQQGDVLRCQLMSVNKSYYDYFTELANVEGRGFSAPTPFNPNGNLSGEVLGYFGIWQASEKVIVVE